MCRKRVSSFIVGSDDIIQLQRREYRDPRDRRDDQTEERRQCGARKIFNYGDADAASAIADNITPLDLAVAT